MTYAIKKDVLSVPTAALTKFSDKEGIFLVEKGSREARFVALEIGIRGLDYVEVLSPALEGEVVVLGQDLLDDGSEVSLPTDAKSSEQTQKRGRG